jgi:hypothetical protein
VAADAVERALIAVQRRVVVALVVRVGGGRGGGSELLELLVVD